ncbi:MAG: DNA replication and repair protein RecF [Spirochaetes bacterium]|nr:DNA replication and repair protein RecF [Spirochaetota bacterium]
MGFLSVRTYNFRNLADGEVMCDAPEVFLVGENGQGKTNFLEAIYVLCYGGSFRVRRDEQLCREGEDQLLLRGRIRDGYDETHDLAYGWESGKDTGKKTIRLNGKPVADRKELVSILPCIIFAHDDIEFVQGSPDRQRFFFDQTLSLYDPLFIDVLRRYRKVLRARNIALKDGRGDLLDVYDRQLAEAGLELLERRSEATAAFNTTFSDLFTGISGFTEPLHIEHRPSWRARTAGEAEAQLSRRREHDFYMKTTTSGPHRDRFVYRQAGRDFTRTASTGQLRLVSLILRVAQAQFFAARSGRSPVLLLDDVLLELDPTRRKRFLDALPGYEQAFFTFLPDERFGDYRRENTLIYRVAEGTIEPYGTGG